MILAALGAVFVFVSVVGYVGSVRAEVGQMTEVLQFTKPVKAFVPIDGSMVRKARIPVKWVSKSMLTETRQLDGKAAGTDIQQGAYVDKGMLVDRPALKAGQREIASLINAETGVAGQVKPGMTVDIYATFQEQQQSRQRACALRIISKALVKEVGQLQSQQGTKADDVDQVVPITFVLSAEDSLKLTHAESFAQEVRLALISREGEATTPKLGPVCQATPSS
ncbi:Flp pilus assembly protein CpaB [Actinomadura darangshiensis]|nr:Flp pilus assembly protein CpaB [Actinomadura darangshiensis]